jgi:hypothetical protein
MTMNSHKTAARVAGVLYIIATVAVIASGPFVGSTDSLDFLTEAAAEEYQVMLGTLLQLAWVLSVMFIPVVLYPVLKLYSETGALGFFSQAVHGGLAQPHLRRHPVDDVELEHGVRQRFW